MKSTECLWKPGFFTSVYCALLAHMLLASTAASAAPVSINMPAKYPTPDATYNMVDNPHFTTDTDWEYHGIITQPIHNPNDGRDNGSVEFPSWNNSSEIRSNRIYPYDAICEPLGFKLNQVYTISFYLKTQHEPLYVHAYLRSSDSVEATMLTGYNAVSATNDWQECISFVEVPDDATWIQVVIKIRPSAIYDATFLVDDVYFGEGISFAEAPAAARWEFISTEVSIDALGNWQVYNSTSSKWNVYFPFALYTHPTRDATAYENFSDQGFNSFLSQMSLTTVQWARDATSTFNPDGMKAGVRLSRFATPSVLDNGDMEFFFDTSRIVDGWLAWGTGDAARDTTESYSGVASIKISHSSDATTMLYQYYPALRANTKYHFSGWIKTGNVVKGDSGSDTGAFMNVYAGGSNIGLPLPALDGTNAWQYFVNTFTTPSSVDEFWYVRLKLQNATGTVWFDDVRLLQDSDRLTELSDTIGIMLDPSNDVLSTLLMYDWDNENNWTTWEHWDDMVTLIRDEDATHPTYLLNGWSNVQRLFGKDLCDVAGTYIGFDESPYLDAALRPFRFEVLQYLEKQDIPVSIAQFNYIDETSYGFRLRLYHALIQGAKGIAWWGDGWKLTRDASGNSVVIDATENYAENRAWWDDIPNLRSEVDQLMPIIKQPHWVSWSVDCSDSSLHYGLRDYNNDGYMIVMNADSTALATFSLTDFTATEVLDFFDNSFVTSVTGDEFTVLMSAHSTAVFRLVDYPFEEILDNGGMETTGTPISDWSTWYNPGGSGVWTRDPTVSFSGNASARIENSNTTDTSLLAQFFDDLKPDTKYRLTAMMRTEDIVRATPGETYNGAFVQIYAGGDNISFPIPRVYGDTEWQLVEDIFDTSHSLGGTWYVRLYLKNASGIAWFDNVSLQELNFLINGSMEVLGSPLEDWGTYDASPSTPVQYARDTTDAYFGAASAKISSDSATDGMFYQVYTALDPNTTYRFRVMMKTDDVVQNDPNNSVHGAYVEVLAGGANEQFPSPALSGDNSWYLVERVFTTPSVVNSTWIVRLRLRQASGVVRFDNANLTKY